MSSNRNTTVRSLHDLGAAAWFGGSLMGAVALNGASGDVSNPVERTKIASSGWARWAPFSAAAIAAHLAGGGGLLLAHQDRVRSQSGVGANTIAKTVLTAAALATTAYSGALGAKLARRRRWPNPSGSCGSCNGPPRYSPARSSSSAPSRASSSAPRSRPAAG